MSTYHINYFTSLPSKFPKNGNLFLLILLLLLSFSSAHLTAQSTSNNTSTCFSCSMDSPPPCEAYVAYFAQPPAFLDLGNISDLFQVSRVSVAESSNLASENIQLFQDQLLLVPITCGCTGNRYFANITYQIKAGDTFSDVSTNSYENLTNYHVIEEFNLDYSPTPLACWHQSNPSFVL